MDVRAILLLGVAQSESEGSGAARETVLQTPLAALDVLGKPLVHRVAEQLLQSGVSAVTIVADEGGNIPATTRQNLPAGANILLAEGPQVWRECERVFEDFSERGAEVVIVWRLGAYAEFDVESLLQAHLDQRARITEVWDANGESLDVQLVCGSRRNDAAYLFRHQLRGSRMPNCRYTFRGYCNRLRSATDLRQLTVDGLLLRNAIKPLGTEVKPGVWLGSGARIQKGARLVAPCYVGAYARVRPAAVITRGSSVEHHVEVDCGTVIENSNVLPFSYIGAGLDVCQAVIGYRKMATLRRNVEVEVTDPKLVGMASEYAPVRAAFSLGSLFAFVPVQVVRSMFARRNGQPQPELADSLNTPSAALREPAAHAGTADNPSPEFPSNISANMQTNMVVARRYGNQ